MSHRILIVDDEPSIRKVLTAHLGRLGHEVHSAEDGGQAMQLLQRSDFDCVVSDLKMPVASGMEVLRWAVAHRPDLPVILITAHGTVDNAVEAIKEGAFDYVTKPFDRAELQAAVAKALATAGRNQERASPSPGVRHGIIGNTEPMHAVFRMIGKVAPSPTTVLITGESGTGKELVARALHAGSPRRDGPFIQINCGAIPDNLFEAELFGYERGAFTGAVTSKPGRFELADGGTLFLDEVGELPRDMQVKILRALQERHIDRVGGLRPVEVDVRVVAATNVDLHQAVRDGDFREDLYYRLNVVPLHLPPLRERIEDIPALVEHFLGRFNERLGKSVQGLSPAALEQLRAHPWPGNIRELENLMERAVLLSDGQTLGVEDLVGLHPPGAEAADAIAPDVQMESMGLKEFVRAHTAKLERARIARALELDEGNVTRAARRLGISRKSLQTKMKEYGLRDR